MNNETTNNNASATKLETATMTPGDVKTDTSVTLEEFQGAGSITLEIQLTSIYLGVEETDGWQHHKYSVTIVNPHTGDVVATTYCAGMFHTGHATSADILSTLLVEAGGIMAYTGITHKNAPPMGKIVPAHSQSWREWSMGMGHTDTEMAKHEFRSTLKTADRLRATIHNDADFQSAIEIAQTR